MSYNFFNFAELKLKKEEGKKDNEKQHSKNRIVAIVIACIVIIAQNGCYNCCTHNCNCYYSPKWVLNNNNNNNKTILFLNS